MNYSRAFSYVFEDKNWLSKVLIAGLISLIPIVGQFYLMGWMIEIVRRTKAGRTDILPTTHFTYFLTLGLKMFVVCLIYSIPVIILSCIIGLLNSSIESTDSHTITIIFTGMGCLGSILTFIIEIAVALLGTYGTIKLAETDQIKDCLDFRDAFETIKNNISTFIIVELLMVVASLISSAGVIVCFIGILFTVPYGTAVTGHLAGQLWNNLKTDNSGRSFRGTVSESVEEVDDVIEEAPFTKVDDIEKNITPEPVVPVSQTPEEPTTAEPADETITEQAEEPVIDTVTEEAAAEIEKTEKIGSDVPESASEDQETDGQVTPETPGTSETDKNDDLPSFE